MEGAMQDKEVIKTDIGYIKLYKMSKGNNWEIKLFDNEADLKPLIEKIEELHNIMLNKFGSEE